MLDDTGAQGVAGPQPVSTTAHVLLAPTAALADSTIRERIARRDSGALALIYDRYGALVYTLALRMTGRPERAEAVVVEVFAQYWRDTSRVPEGDLAAGLIAITRQCARDAGEENGALVVQHSAAGSGQATAARMRAAIDALPPDQRQIVESAYFAGLRVPAIAARLGLSRQTVLRAMGLGMRALLASRHGHED